MDILSKLQVFQKLFTNAIHAIVVLYLGLNHENYSVYLGSAVTYYGVIRLRPSRRIYPLYFYHQLNLSTHYLLEPTRRAMNLTHRWQEPDKFHRSSQIELYQVTGQDCPSVISVGTEMSECNFKWIQATVCAKC